MIDKFFSAEIDQYVETIDLHNMHISTALETMEASLFRLSSAGVPYCKIIHGIGTGALKKAIHNALTGHPMIDDFRLEAHGGSTIVLL